MAESGWQRADGREQRADSPGSASQLFKSSLSREHPNCGETRTDCLPRSGPCPAGPGRGFHPSLRQPGWERGGLWLASLHEPQWAACLEA